LTREDQATPPTSLGDQPILIDGISGESWEETWFFHFLNARKHLSAGLLILDRQAPAAWPFATKDVISRCRALPLISIAEPDEALVAALLLALFHKRGITISSEVVQFLSLRLERTYTAILRAIELLDAQSLQSGRPLTVPFLREMEGILP
jgi:chromosomal replication initiation ATPase DnaA